MGLVTAGLVLAVLMIVLVMVHVIKEGEGGAGAACPQPVMSCHRWLARALPLSAIKIVVVVLQIVTQVGVVVVGAMYR